MNVDAFEDDDLQAKQEERRAMVALNEKKERWKHVLATPQGQAVIWELLEALNVFGTSFAASGSIMSFNEGKRSAGLDILNDWLASSPETFFKTMKEKKGTK